MSPANMLIPTTRRVYELALVSDCRGAPRDPAGNRYGFDVMDATGLPNGTVYPLLRRLQRRRVPVRAWEHSARARAKQRPPRRYYELTGAGEAAMAEVVERFSVFMRIFDRGVASA